MAERLGSLGLDLPPPSGRGGRPPHAMPRKDRSHNRTVVELFAGAGGLALGFDRAGFHTVALVENDKDAAQTLSLNMPGWNVINDGVENINWGRMQKPDVVTGGFPCQAFSYAGKSLGFKDPRGGLIFEMFRCIRKLRPKVVLAENVRGLMTHDNGGTLKRILDGFTECGYCTKVELIEAQYYGVPQKRQRLIIVARSRKLRGTFPPFPTKFSYTVPLKMALEDCPVSAGAEYSATKRSVLEMVPEGGCWVDLPIEVQKAYMGSAFGDTSSKGGRRGMARRLSWDEPSLTILCSPSQKQTERCHPIETRPLTVRESARIQTFPDRWKFCGGIASQYRQIGNAVPVRLSLLLARYVLRCLGE